MPCGSCTANSQGRPKDKAVVQRRRAMVQLPAKHLPAGLVALAILVASSAAAEKAASDGKATLLRDVGVPVRSVNWVHLHPGRSHEAAACLYAVMGQTAENLFVLQIDPETGKFRQFVSRAPERELPHGNAHEPSRTALCGCGLRRPSAVLRPGQRCLGGPGGHPSRGSRLPLPHGRGCPRPDLDRQLPGGRPDLLRSGCSQVRPLRTDGQCRYVRLPLGGQRWNRRLVWSG